MMPEPPRAAIRLNNFRAFRVFRGSNPDFAISPELGTSELELQTAV